MEFKVLMVRAGLNMTQLAQKIGTYQQKVNYWIHNNGQPEYHYLPKLAEALGVSIETIVMAFLGKAV